MWRPAARPSIRTSAASPSRATCPTVVTDCSRSFAAVTGPTPHSASTGERMQELQLAVDRHHQQAVGLGHPAGHLGEELRPGDPDRDRQADPVEDVSAQPHGDLRGVPEMRLNPPTSRNASSIDSPSTKGVVSWNTSNNALLASL